MSDTKITLPNPEIDYFYDGFNPTLGDPLTGASLNARFRPLMENITYIASILETGGLDDQTMEYLKTFMPKTGGIFSGFIQAPTHNLEYESQDFDILNRFETNNLIAEVKSEIISKFGSYTSDVIEGIQTTLNELIPRVVTLEGNLDVIENVQDTLDELIPRVETLEGMSDTLGGVQTTLDDLIPRVVTLEDIVKTLDPSSFEQINSELISLRVQADNSSRQLADLNTNFSTFQDSINSRVTDFETNVQAQLNDLELLFPGLYVTIQGENEILSTNSFKAEQSFYQNVEFKSSITIPESGSINSEGISNLDTINSRNIYFSNLKASNSIYSVNIEPLNLEVKNISTKLESSNELKLQSPTIILSGIITEEFDPIEDESTSEGSGNTSTPTEVIIQTLEGKTELAEVLIKAKVKFTNSSGIDIPEPQESTNPATKKYVDDLIDQQAKSEEDIHNNLINSQNTLQNTLQAGIDTLKTEIDKVISDNEEMTSKVESRIEDLATELQNSVHISGDETISGVKDFTGSAKVVTQSLEDDSTLVANTKFVKNVFKSADHQYSDFTLNSNEIKTVQFDSVNNYLARDARVLVYDEPNEMWINGESLITLGFTSQGFKLINESSDDLQVKVILI